MKKSILINRIRLKMCSTGLLFTFLLVVLITGCEKNNNYTASPKRVFGEIMGLGVKFKQGQPMSDLETLTDLGVRWVRDSESWAKFEPVPGEYGFSEKFKKRLRFYKENNIGIVFILAYSNPEAYPPTSDNPYSSVDPEAFGRYAAAVARKLKEWEVEFVLEVWNEPHNFVLRKMFGGPWHGQPPSPWLDHYMKMLKAAVKETKSFDPEIKILSDEDCTIIHYRFMEAGLPGELDGFAFHPYMRGKNSTPEIAEEGYGKEYEKPFVQTDDDHSFRSMVRRLREQGKMKLGKTPELWITEFGCPVNEEVSENVTFSLGKSTESELPGILIRAFIGAEAAGIKVFCWFSSWDGPDGPMGLISKDGQKRKTYYGYKTLSEQLGDYSLTEHIAGKDHLTDGFQTYLFHKGKEVKVVAWSIDGLERKLILHGPLQKTKIIDALGNPVHIAKDDSGKNFVTIGISPVYISNVRGEKSVKSYFQNIE